MTRHSLDLLALLALLGCASTTPGASTVAPASTVTRPLPGKSDAPPENSLVVDLGDGPVPWTHLDLKNSPNTFQFAIVSDRTGGARPGVFASAVRKLNLLQPEFVMSVGDLIEGYTEDRARLEREWEEFDAIVKGLDAPFFYLPGNHDITNRTMRDVWHERYGPSRYSFVYKNVLFVCLDSMDGGLHQVSEQQLSWLKQTLTEHADVDWTLLFMHSPFWDAEGGGGTPTWDVVEDILGQRNYTAFAGHYHRYTKHVRKDHRLITLATTGGVSSLRGPRYGEFDHVAWVTMSPSGPRLANLMLDGIWDENVRTEDIRQFQSVLFGGSMHPTPLFFDNTFNGGTSQLRLVNDEDYPYRVKFIVETSGEYSTPTPELEVLVPPNSVVDRSLEIRSKVATSDVTSFPLQWRAEATIEGQDVAFSGHSAIGIAPLLRAHSQSPTVDGDLTDWGKLRFDGSKPAQVLGQAESWHGTEDARFAVDVSADSEFVYVGVLVVDDQVRVREEGASSRWDGVEIRLDARPDPKRSHFGAAHDGKDALLLALNPSEDAGWLRREDWIQIPAGVVAKCVQVPSGFSAEVAVPRSWIAEQAGGGEQRIRLNVAVTDDDDDGRAQLCWWPDWRSSQQIPGSGTFVLE